jgi:hypothetical protein
MDRAAVRRRRDEAEAHDEVAVLCAASSSHADWKAAGANAVLGGIAAADAICGAVLGYHHIGEDHSSSRVSRSQTDRLVTALDRLVVTMRQKTDSTS